MGFFREWGSARNMFAYTDYAAIREAAEEGFEEGYLAAQEIFDHDRWDDTPEAESPFLNQQYLQSLDKKMNQIQRDFPKIKIKLAEDGWTFEEIIEKYMFLNPTPETMNTYNTIKKKGENFYDLISDLDLKNEILSLDPKLDGDAFFWDGGKGRPSDTNYFSHMVITNGRIRRTGKHLGVKVKVDWLSDGRCVVSLIEVIGPVQKKDELITDTRFHVDAMALKRNINEEIFIWDNGRLQPHDPSYVNSKNKLIEKVILTGKHLGIDLVVRWTKDGQCVVSLSDWKNPTG